MMTILYQNLTKRLAKHLGIKVHANVSIDEMRDKISQYGKSSAPKTFIENGELYVMTDASWSLAIHELLHIAVVEPEYREKLTHDTQKCYAEINKISPERKSLRSESATLGLQYHVYDHFNLSGYLGGSFFNGWIRHNDENFDAETRTCIPSSWREKGLILFNELFGDLNESNTADL